MQQKKGSILVETIRLYKYDLLKGFAILSVVLFHIIRYFAEYNPFLWNIEDICDQFQMPTFSFVAGYFFYNTLAKNDNELLLLCKKVKRLLIPWLVVGSLYFFSKAFYLSFKGLYEIDFLDYLKSMITLHAVKIIDQRGLGFGPVWFLMMLFIVMIISYIFAKINVVFLTGAIFVISFFIPQVPKLPDLSPSSIIYYFIPFQMGYLLNLKHVFFESFINKYRYLLLSIFLLVIVIMNVLVKKEIIQNKTVLISIAWILFLYIIAEIIEFKFTLVSYLGRKSMLIYLWHAPYFTFASLLLVSKVELHYAIELFIVLCLCVAGPIGLGIFYDKIIRVLFNYPVFLKSKIKP